MVSAYCVKCKEKREFDDGVEKMTTTGRKMLQGHCKVCGTKVNVFLKSDKPASEKKEKKENKEKKAKVNKTTKANNKPAKNMKTKTVKNKTRTKKGGKVEENSDLSDSDGSLEEQLGGLDFEDNDFSD